MLSWPVIKLIRADVSELSLILILQTLSDDYQLGRSGILGSGYLKKTRFNIKAKSVSDRSDSFALLRCEDADKSDPIKQLLDWNTEILLHKVIDQITKHTVN